MGASMSSKSRYRIGEIVRIKATGEKVKIVNYGGNSTSTTEATGGQNS